MREAPYHEQAQLFGSLSLVKLELPGPNSNSTGCGLADLTGSQLLETLTRVLWTISILPLQHPFPVAACKLAAHPITE